MASEWNPRGTFHHPKTRIGQYLSFDAESLSMYDGSYGIGKQHDEKYVNEEVPQKRGRGRPPKNKD